MRNDTKESAAAAATKKKMVDFFYAVAATAHRRVHELPPYQVQNLPRLVHVIENYRIDSCYTITRQCGGGGTSRHHGFD